MRIYIGHPKIIDYRKELYEPLKNDSFFKNHELILPHDKSDSSITPREFYKTIDIFIAECSEKATGLGIELGWAYDDMKKIYCIFQKGKKISGSLRAVTDKFYEYNNSQEMVNIVKSIINKEQEKQKGTDTN